MTPEMEALGRRAVACKGWRWMPGMRWVNDPAKPLTSEGDEGRHEYGYTPPKYGIPDLTDPATLGCLLALVREAHRQGSLSPVKVGRYRWCLADYGTTALDGGTEAELLVAALEAAP